MKQASRFMPQYLAPKVNKLGLLGALALFMALVIFQPVVLAILAGVALLVIIGSLIEKPKMERYFYALSQERTGLSICEFTREFDVHTVDTWIIRATYEQLQAALPTKHKIPIKGSDDLIGTLKLDEEDLDFNLAEEIAQRTGRSLANLEDNPYYGKVTTARNLVMFFNHQPRVEKN
jgi:hypothetical protein